MNKKLSSIDKAYLAGLLDGDGSIYIRAKPNPTYKYGFQIAPYIVFFQSAKNKKLFDDIFSPLGIGIMRERKDGIIEYAINKKENLMELAKNLKPHLILKKEQICLLEKIVKAKEKIKDSSDFKNLLNLIDNFRNLNYSKKRKKRTLTP